MVALAQKLIRWPARNFVQVAAAQGGGLATPDSNSRVRRDNLSAGLLSTAARSSVRCQCCRTSKQRKQNLTISINAPPITPARVGTRAEFPRPEPGPAQKNHTTLRSQTTQTPTVPCGILVQVSEYRAQRVCAERPRPVLDCIGLPRRAPLAYPVQLPHPRRGSTLAVDPGRSPKLLARMRPVLP
jgi:hypothetical protein